MGVRFAVLGDVEAQVDGVRVDLGHSRQRCVLVALLVDVNRVVPTGRLIDRVWGDRAPERARTTLYGYLHRLRKVFPPGCGAVIERRSGGYVLVADAREVDLHRFAGLVEQARTTSDRAEALGLLDRAVALWRGEPFAGLDTPWLAEVRSEVERGRVDAEVDRAELALERGRHAEVVDVLRPLVAAHWTDERLAVRLLRALHRGERRGEALTFYRTFRDRLVEELGAEPGAPLREAFQEVLVADQGLPASPAGSVGAWRQLPMDVEEFTGRDRDLRQLREWARIGSRPASSAPTIAVITGMAGVGKTRLAVRVAHSLVADGRFDEVQLWSDLHGFHEARDPADPSAVLERFLRLLDVPGERIPQDLDSRAALYRDRLVGRRALVLLDNAASAEQVRPLLPASPGALVLVTSRHVLSEVDGARLLPLDVLSRQESVTVLARVVDDGRVAVEPEAAAKVAQLCGNLPLAVVLAARRLRTRPRWTVADLADHLTPSGRRPATALTSLDTVFDLSYRALPPVARRTFRLLALQVGDDFTAESVAALSGHGVEDAEQQLEHLLDEHLVQQADARRYRLHDLVREYARRRTAVEGDEVDRAVRRLLVWYLHAAESARGVLDPTRVRIIDLPEPPADVVVPSFSGYDDAVRWFEQEHAALTAAVRTAAAQDLAVVAWQLAWVLLSFHYPRSHWDDWIGCYHAGLAAAKQAGLRRGEGIMWRGLGVAYSDLRRYDTAVHCHVRAQGLLEEVGDVHGQAWNLNNLGVIHVDLGELDRAADCFRRALPMFRATGDRQGEGFALNNLGDTYLGLGRTDLAADHLERALAIQRETDDQMGLQFTLSTLGELHHRTGSYGEALRYHREALALSRRLNHPRTTARALTNLARTHDQLDEPAEARRHRQEAHDIFQEIGDPQAAEVQDPVRT
ncbi:AfsR/SARP family transcriptional regulator [Saccharothrix luteola]|uniref:AfsR/SARP family transcriptional regulator n=1 Tax=Saccharothrix luteola TaxID=2893018 RepID=UPI001E557115|nr:AfsR/SARP family transcriptional regulator [Saccharothrix luteola]MCC8242758.1 tetratricopeptide repeat protein [Saccharothrix luteola]